MYNVLDTYAQVCKYSVVYLRKVMPRRTKEQAAETRESIISAALDVFSRQGYCSTTLNDIAKEIGLTKGAVYWHFKNKSDLLAELINYYERRYYSNLMDARPDSIAEFRDKLEQISNQLVTDKEAQKFEFLCSFQIEWSVEFLAEVHERLKELRDDPKIEFSRTLSHLQKIGQLRQDINIEKLTYSMCAIWMGMLDLALVKEITFETFHVLMLENFDRIMEQHSSL